MFCKVKHKMLFDLETENYKSKTNFKLTYQLVFVKIAQFYNTLTLEQKDASWILSISK